MPDRGEGTRKRLASVDRLRPRHAAAGGCDTLRRMDYRAYSIHLLKPMEEFDIDRIFPRPDSKRKQVFKLITNGMTVADWLGKVSRAGLEKVDVSFITQCYAKDEPSRYERRLVELRPPSRQI